MLTLLVIGVLIAIDATGGFKHTSSIIQWLEKTGKRFCHWVTDIAKNHRELVLRVTIGGTAASLWPVALLLPAFLNRTPKIIVEKAK